MAHGAPDYTTVIEVHYNEGQAADERAAGAHGAYSGVAQTYQTVCTWTVATGYTGELKEILILSDDYSHTDIKISVGSLTPFTDWAPTGAMPIIYEDLRLAAADTVVVYAKSDDGTAIVVNAIIVGKEVAI